jgi:ribosome-associated toxin RatA of RatAB toxin-antitoxin module
MVVSRRERWNGLDGGLAAIVVDAPVDVVWKHIVDYDAYVVFLPYVTASSLDATWPLGDHTVYDCSMQLTTKGIVTRYKVRNWRYDSEGYMTFRMLPMAGNPLDQATGYWRVEPWSEDARRTLMAYRIDVDTSWYIPAFIRNKAAARALPTVVQLIADRAEAEAAGTTP